MEEIHTIAEALYNNASYDTRAAVKELFNSIDTDGNGSISKEEFMHYLKTKCSKYYQNPRFFSALDKDGNGSLDFKELLAFFYFRNFRGVSCDVCSKFLFGFYFTCARCFMDGKMSYDLCLNCFQRNNHHHQHTEFMDNYAMLKGLWNDKRKAASGSGYEATGSGGSEMAIYTGGSVATGGGSSGANGSSEMVIYHNHLEATRPSKMGKILEVIGLFNTGYQFGDFLASAAATGLCTIM